MAATTRTRSIRTLGALGVVLALLYGGIAAAAQWSTAAWTPGLGLDLAGGTRVILTPVAQPGQSGEVTEDTIDDAIEIIRQRVDGSGIGEANVSAQGSQNILVELPGDPQTQQATLELIRQSARMTFRPVLAVAGPTPIDATAQPGEGAPTDAPTAGATAPSTEAPATETPSTEAPATDAPATDAPATAEPTPGSTQGSVIPPALRTAPTTGAPTTGAPATDAPATEAPATEAPGEQPTDAPTSEPTSASDLAWITPDLAAEFAALDCTDPANRTGGTESDDVLPLATCDQTGSAKYLLGPVELTGSDLTGASSQPATNDQGFSTGGWVVTMDFTRAGGDAFADITSRISQLPPPQNQFGIVLDGLVISAPSVNGPIPGGQARIDDGGSGTFTQESTQTLANQLRFGSLPVSFEVQTQEQISATLGTEQLQRGVLAGLIGLGLVVVYSLLQYRLLGLVTVASLAVAGLLAYGAITLLSWTSGYRLSLPGVAGLIIAIGVTADSFIVYFERVRDEVREGRSVAAAVQTGWARARRTIIISDVVQLLAAVVLYVLAVGGVQGFAFTLGLTTLIDLLVVVMLTHPVVTLLARTRFFASGHRLSGFDAEHLGRTVYAGRGRVAQPASGRDLAAGADDRPPADDDGGGEGERRRRDRTPGDLDPAAAAQPRRMTIAERRAAEARERQEQEEGVPDGGSPSGDGSDGGSPDGSRDSAGGGDPAHHGAGRTTPTED
ncbi:protein translocase subunit SecD [uncultured Pseudokineococcus sp.]|uniref:protein translocase subunit SecD n=1 Tax=uncultured Pseudokineococcus sp. TaxID=1642928 RepID=UPI0026331DEA|nr:protein translocase subunit SecD [uncultured Pseudokineococcus sp.]